MFIGFEAEEVLNILLSSQASEDFFAWNYMKRGMYSVKSGYYFIKFYKESVLDGASTTSDPFIWKNLWDLDVDPKVRVCGGYVKKFCLHTKSCIKGLHAFYRSVKGVTGRKRTVFMQLGVVNMRLKYGML